MAVGRGVGRREPANLVATQPVGDQKFVLLEEHRDRPLPAGRLLERVSNQVGDGDEERLRMPANDRRCKTFDVDVDALAVQQVALLVDGPAHQGCDRKLFAIQPVVGFACDAQEHLDRGFHLERRPPDPIHRLHVLGRQIALLQQLDRARDHGDGCPQLVAGGTGEVPLAHDERADALERLRDGTGEDADLVRSEPAGLDELVVSGRQMFQVDARDHVGELHHRGDRSAHHQDAQPETQRAEHADDTGDDEQPPPVLGGCRLDPGDIEHHECAPRCSVGGDDRDMQLFGDELVHALAGA